METLLTALLIFCLRICDVSLGTIRVIVSIQGRRYLAAGIGFVEVSIFIFAIGKAMSGIDNLINVFAYSGGFAAGTMLGILLEGKIALGHRVVRIIVHKREAELTQMLRDHGFAVTRLMGEGKKGPVAVLFSVIRRRDINSYMKIVNEIAPNAFVTLEETRETRHGYFSPILSKLK